MQLCYHKITLHIAAVIDMKAEKSADDARKSRGLLRQQQDKQPSTWVQTERMTHEAWGRLCVRSPRASALMHYLVAQMTRSDAVIASWATLADISGLSVATVRRAISDLRADNWIEVVQIGGKGGANAIVINSRVGWTQDREKLKYAHFSASVIARSDEQLAIDVGPLRSIPIMQAGEHQLPSGPGAEPPSQPNFPGMEPDLPAIHR